MTEIIEPGYDKLDPQRDLPLDEAKRIRIRVEFKAKLKHLTVKHDPKQEFCKDCETLPNSPVAPSSVSLRRVITNLGPQPKVQRRSTKGQEERSYGVSSESSEYFKEHAELKTPGPNPKRIPHDEIGNLMACFTNLHTAHEIAINRCYRLQVTQEDKRASQVKTEMKQAFWDLLQEEVDAKKSLYNQTLALMAELKTALHSLMMPHNHELREQVDKALDLERMRQEVKNNKFDFECYPDYIIDVLAQICCPSRDQELEKLRLIKDPVPLFKSMFDLIEKMKLDMENFFIHLYRPYITRTLIENERKKFADYLELEYRLHEDGLRATRSWLHRHRIGVRDALTVIAKAYGEILYWTTKEMWPETLLEDVERFHKLQVQLDRIGVVGGVILELGKVGQKIFKNPPPGLRQIFSKYMKLLIPPGKTEDEEKLKVCLENAAQHAIQAMEMVITKYLKRQMRDNEKQQVHDAVVSVLNKKNTFRCLIVRRTVDYSEDIIIASHEYHTSVPSTLTPVMYDVGILVNEFHRIVLHNRACFEELYRDICNGTNRVPVYPPYNDGNWDNQLLDTLKKLRSGIATPEKAQEIARRISEARIKIDLDDGNKSEGEIDKDETKSLFDESARPRAMNGDGITSEQEQTEFLSSQLVQDGVMLKFEGETFKEFCQDCKEPCKKFN